MKIYFIFPVILLSLLVFYPKSLETVSYQVYFCPKDDCKSVFVEEIKKSSHTLCAIHEIDPSLKEIFSNSEIVFEKKYENFDASFVTWDHNSALMHNKFCVLDGDRVLTGSMNPTNNGFNYNDNNLVLIYSSEIAEVFTKEFYELKYGSENRAKTYPGIYFCPEDNCRDRLIQNIRNSNESIHFAAFAFTDYAIATELILAKQRNVSVIGVLEKRMGSKMYDYLLSNRINVRFDNNPKTMHHKFFVFDSKKIWTGSYNPTGNGNYRNDENVVEIRDRGLAERFVQEVATL